MGADPAARPLGDGQGGADACRMGPQDGRLAADRGRRQSVADPGQPRRHRRRGLERALRQRPRRRPADAGADRKLDRPGSGRRRQGVERAEALDVRIAMDDFGTGYTSLDCSSGCRSTCSRSTRASSAADGRGRRFDRDRPRHPLASRALGMETTAEGIDTVELARCWPISAAPTARASISPSR